VSLQELLKLVVFESEEKLASVKGKRKITNKWVHLAGVLTKDKKMRLYVDGALVGEAMAPGLVAKTPVQGLQIGADAGTSVGEYATPFAFKGVVDEVRVYHRALNEQEMEKLADWGNEPKDKSLVLYSGFEKGKAIDDSGNKHSGKLSGVNIVARVINGFPFFKAGVKHERLVLGFIAPVGEFFHLLLIQSPVIYPHFIHHSLKGKRRGILSNRRPCIGSYL
jgi:hypothetical protein